MWYSVSAVCLCWEIMAEKTLIQAMGNINIKINIFNQCTVYLSSLSYFVMAAQGDKHKLCSALALKPLCGHVGPGKVDWIANKEWALFLPRLEIGVNGLSYLFFLLNLTLVSSQASKGMQMGVGSLFLGEEWQKQEMWPACH